MKKQLATLKVFKTGYKYPEIFSVYEDDIRSIGDAGMAVSTKKDTLGSTYSVHAEVTDIIKSDDSVGLYISFSKYSVVIPLPKKPVPFCV